jgi:hypothetical protein
VLTGCCLLGRGWCGALDQPSWFPSLLAAGPHPAHATVLLRTCNKRPCARGVLWSELLNSLKGVVSLGLHLLLPQLWCCCCCCRTSRKIHAAEPVTCLDLDIVTSAQSEQPGLGVLQWQLPGLGVSRLACLAEIYYRKTNKQSDTFLWDPPRIPPS